MLDEIDVKILEILQRKGRTKRNDLADAVGLSLPSVGDRLKKLEENGIITGYHAVLDHKKLCRDITAFIFVTIDSSKHFNQFLEHANALDEIQECHAITGEASHLLKIRTTNTASLEKLLAKIQAWGGVISTKTNLVLSTSKETTRIRVEATK
ncbi:MAG TPA: Lrp/AsnC family transcriptional regulator [Saprospiraceae bacterium]|nr:Lrp/AsnC family transcriptional regulator [Saprospiraceae bacterium]